MQRVSVVGNSGSGKSTLARKLASILGVPHLELDSVYHQPGWQRLPADEFQRVVAARAAADGWVMDGNYSAVRPESVISWSWHSHGKFRRRYAAAAADPAYAHLTFVRLGSRRDAARFLTDPSAYPPLRRRSAAGG